MKLLNWLSKKLKNFPRKVRRKFAGYSAEMIVLVVYVLFVAAILVFLFMIIHQD